MRIYNIQIKLELTKANHDASFSFELNPHFPHFGDIIYIKIFSKQVKSQFAKDISAEKNTYVYDAHTYHTKVPPQGIKPLVECIPRSIRGKKLFRHP